MQIHLQILVLASKFLASILIYIITYVHTYYIILHLCIHSTRQVAQLTNQIRYAIYSTLHISYFRSFLQCINFKVHIGKYRQSLEFSNRTTYLVSNLKSSTVQKFSSSNHFKGCIQKPKIESYLLYNLHQNNM